MVLVFVFLLIFVFVFVHHHPHPGSFAETKVLPNPCLVHARRCLLNGACVCLSLNICICLCASSSSSWQFCGNKSLPQSASCARAEHDSLGHPAASIQAACPKDIFYLDWRRIIFIVAIRHSIGMDEALSISKQLHTAQVYFTQRRIIIIIAIGIVPFRMGKVGCVQLQTGLMWLCQCGSDEHAF